MCQVPTESLTLHDQQVLDTIFGFEKSNYDCSTKQVNLNLPPDQHVCTSTVEKLVGLEKEAIRLEACGDLDAAMAIVNGIIVQEPKYASAYNNRAQLYRIKHPDDLTSKAVTGDLESAIALALPEKPITEVSKMQATVLRSAYNQFAALYLEQSRRPENSQSSWQLQLKASDMMVEASNYGEKIAATLAAHVNPYAKLCGNMMELALGAYRQ